MTFKIQLGSICFGDDCPPPIVAKKYTKNDSTISNPSLPSGNRETAASIQSEQNSLGVPTTVSFAENTALKNILSQLVTPWEQALKTAEPLIAKSEQDILSLTSQQTTLTDTLIKLKQYDNKSFALTIPLLINDEKNFINDEKKQTVEQLFQSLDELSLAFESASKAIAPSSKNTIAELAKELKNIIVTKLCEIIKKKLDEIGKGTILERLPLSEEIIPLFKKLASISKTTANKTFSPQNIQDYFLQKDVNPLQKQPNDPFDYLNQATNNPTNTNLYTEKRTELLSTISKEIISFENKKNELTQKISTQQNIIKNYNESLGNSNLLLTIKNALSVFSNPEIKESNHYKKCEELLNEIIGNPTLTTASYPIQIVTEMNKRLSLIKKLKETLSETIGKGEFEAAQKIIEEIIKTNASESIFYKNTLPALKALPKAIKPEQIPTENKQTLSLILFLLKEFSLKNSLIATNLLQAKNKTSKETFDKQKEIKNKTLNDQKTQKENELKNLEKRKAELATITTKIKMLSRLVTEYPPIKQTAEAAETELNLNEAFKRSNLAQIIKDILANPESIIPRSIADAGHLPTQKFISAVKKQNEYQTDFIKYANELSNLLTSENKITLKIDNKNELSNQITTIQKAQLAETNKIDINLSQLKETITDLDNQLLTVKESTYSATSNTGTSFEDLLTNIEPGLEANLAKNSAKALLIRKRDELMKTFSSDDFKRKIADELDFNKNDALITTFFTIEKGEYIEIKGAWDQKAEFYHKKAQTDEKEALTNNLKNIITNLPGLIAESDLNNDLKIRAKQQDLIKKTGNLSAAELTELKSTNIPTYEKIECANSILSKITKDYITAAHGEISKNESKLGLELKTTLLMKSGRSDKSTPNPLPSPQPEPSPTNTPVSQPKQSMAPTPVAEATPAPSVMPTPKNPNIEEALISKFKKGTLTKEQILNRPKNEIVNCLQEIERNFSEKTKNNLDANYIQNIIKWLSESMNTEQKAITQVTLPPTLADNKPVEKPTEIIPSPAIEPTATIKKQYTVLELVKSYEIIMKGKEKLIATYKPSSSSSSIKQLPVLITKMKELENRIKKEDVASLPDDQKEKFMLALNDAHIKAENDINKVIKAPMEAIDIREALQLFFIQVIDWIPPIQSKPAQ